MDIVTIIFYCVFFALFAYTLIAVLIYHYIIIRKAMNSENVKVIDLFMNPDTLRNEIFKDENEFFQKKLFRRGVFLISGYGILFLGFIAFMLLEKYKITKFLS